jgi:hypothetical protein
MKIQMSADHNDQLDTALERVLAERGARRLWRWRGHAGSQELVRELYFVRGRLLRIQRETYLGTTIIGSRILVTTIAADIARILSPNITPLNSRDDG